MAGNPLVAQGVLNRLRASVVVPAFPQLNVTPAFLGKEMIGITLEGNTSTYIDTATGAVVSPEPYQRVSVTLHLLRTQFLADLYKLQQESSSFIGDVTVRPDSSVLSPYQFNNCSIMSTPEQKFDGTDPGYRVTIGGVYYINASLWGAG